MTEADFLCQGLPAASPFRLYLPFRLKSLVSPCLSKIGLQQKIENQAPHDSIFSAKLKKCLGKQKVTSLEIDIKGEFYSVG